MDKCFEWIQNRFMTAHRQRLSLSILFPHHPRPLLCTRTEPQTTKSHSIPFAPISYDMFMQPHACIQTRGTTVSTLKTMSLAPSTYQILSRHQSEVTALTSHKPVLSFFFHCYYYSYYFGSKKAYKAYVCSGNILRHRLS